MIMVTCEQPICSIDVFQLYAELLYIFCLHYIHIHTRTLFINCSDLRRNQISTVEDGTFALKNILGLSHL